MKIRITTLLLIGGSILFTFKNSYAQEYLINNLGFKEGLVSAGIDAIVFDEEKYMWIGGDNDLCRYDGVNLIKCDRTNGWPISAGWVYNLSLDTLKNLWVCTTDTCLFTVFNKNKSSRKFIFYPEIRNPLKVIHMNGSSWVTTDSNLFQIKNYKIVQSFSYPQQPVISRFNPLASFKDQIYIASSVGLLKFDPSSRSFTLITGKDGLTGTGVRSVHTVNRELFIVHDSSITVLNEKFEKYCMFNDNLKIKYVFKDHEGFIWCVGRKGILVLKNGIIVHELNMRNNTFGSNEFAFGCSDHENNIWLASTTNGIYQIRKKSLTRYGDIKNRWSPVYGVTQDKKNNYWFGHYNAYFLVKLTTDPVIKADTIYVEIDPTLNVYDSINDRVWFSGYDGVLSIQNDKITTYADESKFASEDPWNSVFNPYDTAVYFTGSYGLTKIKNEKFSSIYPENSKSAQKDIFIFEGAPTNHGLYLGTKYGIKKVEQDKIVDVPGLDKGQDARAIVTNIVSDCYQNVWADIGNNTLIRIGVDPNGKKFIRRYNIFNMFGVKGPFNMSANNNFFALKTFSTLYILDLKALLNEKLIFIKKLDETDGITNEAPQYQEILFDNNQSIWICGEGGAFCYKFLEDIRNLQEPHLHIQQISINGKMEDLSPFSDSTSGADELPVNLKLPSSKNELRFNFIGINYKGGEKVLYKTRLKGLQREWSEPFKDRYITYNNLSAGEYTFQLISCNNDGVWNKKPIEFAFTIRPPWYQQTWFRLLSAIVFVGLIYLIFMMRIVQLRKAKKAQEKLTMAILESQEEERRKIAGDLHDGVGQELSMLKMTAEKEGSDKIQSKVNKIIEDVRLLSRNIHPHYFEKLGLTRAVQTMVDEQQSFGNKFWIHELENIDPYFKTREQLIIFRVIQESINNIIKHSEAKNVKITFEKSGSTVVINIMDNGKGFVMDPNKINSLGLSTIRERIKSINGQFLIKSKPGNGTQTTLIIPVKV